MALDTDRLAKIVGEENVEFIDMGAYEIKGIPLVVSDYKQFIGYDIDDAVQIDCYDQEKVFALVEAMWNMKDDFFILDELTRERIARYLSKEE